MKLITQELKKRFSKIGDQQETDNPIVIAKFFNPTGGQSWYVTEYNPETKICKGYVTGMGYDEWGHFSMEELESVTLPYGLKIERDMFFKETSFKDLQINEEPEQTPLEDIPEKDTFDTIRSIHDINEIER